MSKWARTDDFGPYTTVTEFVGEMDSLERQFPESDYYIHLDDLIKTAMQIVFDWERGIDPPESLPDLTPKHIAFALYDLIHVIRMRDEWVRPRTGEYRVIPGPGPAFEVEDD